MLSTAELAQLRATLDESLPDTAIIQRATRASDGMGGFDETWSNAGTVECRVSPSGREPEERMIAERLGSVTLWTVTLPAETNVTAADRIAVDSRAFEVVAVLARRSYEISTRVVCREVV